MSDPPARRLFRIDLEALEGGSVPLERRLARLLKAALRAHGFRCHRVLEIGHGSEDSPLDEGKALTTFEDGPAAGIPLLLRRASYFLRVVRDGEGKTDALDQLADAPAAGETVSVYVRTAPAKASCSGMLHIDSTDPKTRRRRGDWYTVASYRLWSEPPDATVLCDNALWAAWCRQTYERIQVKPGSLCGSCGAKVLWVKTSRGKSMPLDAEPHPEGNVRCHADGTVLVLSTAAAAAVAAVGEPLYRSHFATCPHAAAHRKK